MRCTQLLLIIVDDAAIVIIALIKYPTLSSKTLSAILLLYLEHSVRDTLCLYVVFSVKMTRSPCACPCPCLGFHFSSCSLPHSAISL